MINEKMYSLFWLVMCSWSAAQLIRAEGETGSAKKVDDPKELADFFDSVSRFFSPRSTTALIAFVFLSYIVLDSIGFFLTYTYTQLDGLRYQLLVIVTTMFAFDSATVVVTVKELCGMILSGRTEVKDFEELFPPEETNADRPPVLLYLLSYGKLLVALQLFLWLYFPR